MENKNFRSNNLRVNKDAPSTWRLLEKRCKILHDWYRARGNYKIRYQREYHAKFCNELSLGQEFHTNGILSIKEADIDGEKYVYVAVETKEGIDLDITLFLKIPTWNALLTNFKTEGTFVSERIENGKIVTKSITAKVIPDFNYEKVYQAPDRAQDKFIEISEKEELFKYKIIRYLGSVVCQYEASKDSREIDREQYKAGMKRAFCSFLFEVEDTPEGVKYRQELERKRQIIAEQERIRRQEEERKRELARYNERNTHHRDQYLRFDATNHKYYVDGLCLQSVTNFVENCFPKFDTMEHAKRTAVRLGKTIDEVIEMWDNKGKESSRLGTELHNKIERYFKYLSFEEDEAFRLFKVFVNRIKLNPYRTEWAVYDTDYNIAGTIDFVDYQDGKYIIYDWKRSDKIVSNGMPVKTSKYDQKALPPIQQLEDCAYYHYALQLSIYKFILEKNYCITVDELRLGIFHPSYDKPYILKIPYLEDEIKILMSYREDILL